MNSLVLLEDYRKFAKPKDSIKMYQNRRGKSRGL